VSPVMAAPLTAVDSCRVERTGPTLTIVARMTVRALRGIPAGPVIYPGIFVIESLCQAVARGLPEAATLRVLRSVRYLAPVPRGDELTLRIDATPRDGGNWTIKAVGTRRDGTVTARISAEFGADPGLLPGPAEPPPEPAPVLDHAQVRAILPQRHPLLLVDRVLALEPGRSIRTSKAVTGSEPCYAGLPDDAGIDRYGYPRSLMIGSFGQSAMLLWLAGRRPADDRSMLWVGARDYRFAGTVLPGDVLVHEARLDFLAADTTVMSGESRVGDRRVATVAALLTTRRTVSAPRE
jgi:3-hydroxymyristoyl/3-hydroxydecanoyl-(acyl carrier protein) dehydratase